MCVAIQKIVKKPACVMNYIMGAVFASLVAIVFAMNCMNLGKKASLMTKERIVLSKQDIEDMTDGQRQILFVGMSMERQRITKMIEQEGKPWEVVLISEIVEKIKDGK
jgi:hypothetical protein